MLKTRIRRAWHGSGCGWGGNNRARNLQDQKVVIPINLFHIGDERILASAVSRENTIPRPVRRTGFEPCIPLEPEVGAQLDVGCRIGSFADTNAEEIEVAEKRATGTGRNF